MDSLTCRRATARDLGSIVELWIELMDLHRELLPYPLVENAAAQHQEHIAKRLDNDSSLILVAELNGAIVGYCRAGIASYAPVYEQQPYGAIAELIVIQALRRQGIGEALYYKTKDWFKERGVTRLEVATASGNPSSNAFWKKMGFKTFREVKQFSME
jgi:ribosomal protein S18 acetylase RimI-like enzyme